MRHLRFTALAVVALALCAAPVAVAKAPKKDGVVAPVHSVAGLSGSELLGEGWVALLSNPVGTHSGSCVPLGNKGKVLAPEPDEDLTASCTVKPGTPIVIFFGSECSNVEPDPFFGETEAQQRACAVAFDHEFFVAATITVDDGRPVDILIPRFELISPQRSVVLPPDNFLGVDPGPATFVAHGWVAIVRGLGPGQHTIAVEVTDVTGFTSIFTATINVVPGGRSSEVQPSRAGNRVGDRARLRIDQAWAPAVVAAWRRLVNRQVHLGRTVDGRHETR
jgi:hypothetical protein